MTNAVCAKISILRYGFAVHVSQQLMALGRVKRG